MIGDVLRGCLSIISNLHDIAILGVFLATMMTLAAATNIVRLVTFSTISVVSGVLLGRAALGIAGLNFATSAIFFSIAMLGLAIHHRIYGREEAFRALNNILFALTVVFGALFLLDSCGLLNPLFNTSIRHASLRLICIYLAQSLAIHLLDKPCVLPPVIQIPAVVMLVEILEGSIFYPCVLLGEDLPTSTIEYTVSSIGIRLMTTMIALPFLIAFLVLERRGVVARCAQPT